MEWIYFAAAFFRCCNSYFRWNISQHFPWLNFEYSWKTWINWNGWRCDFWIFGGRFCIFSFYYPHKKLLITRPRSGGISHDSFSQIYPDTKNNFGRRSNKSFLPQRKLYEMVVRFPFHTTVVNPEPTPIPEKISQIFRFMLLKFGVRLACLLWCSVIPQKRLLTVISN